MTESLSLTSASLGPVRLEGTPVLCFWTGSSHGDQRLLVQGGSFDARELPPELPKGVRVVGARQVHGNTVVFSNLSDIAASDRTGSIGGEGLPDADAIVSADRVSCPAVLTADCVSVALGSPEGVRAAVHAGWRGLVGGVIGAAAIACRSTGASVLVAGIGPCIGPCCYEFSPQDLDVVERALGSGLRSTTRDGRPSLDIREAALRQLLESGADVVSSDTPCTACGDGWFSARAHKDTDRQALYVWRDS